MKLEASKKLMGILYQCVFEKMERVDRNTKPIIVDELQELEILLSDLLTKST